MKKVFSAITGLSLRFRAITMLLVVAVSVLGVVGLTQLKQELVPSIEFPATFIITQVSGMTSDQVLAIVTEPLEEALDAVPEIVNLESSTTGSFGSLIQARNDFGVDQARLRGEIRTALDSVWLPLRRIQSADGEDPQAFSARLLGDMTPEVMIYLAEKYPNFLFQLTPEVWSALPDETLRTVLAYMADQVVETESEKGALQRLIDQEIVPQIESVEMVASVEVKGGQALPGEEVAVVDAPVDDGEAESLLLQLSPKVWEVVAPRVGLGAQNADAVAALADVDYTIPETPPALPESWQMDRFVDVTDLIEVQTLTRNIAGVINAFYEEGRIVGSLGQTNDLTPEVVTRMLEIDPTLVEHFEAEHLAAMPADVFAVLPEDYIASLDGFTRDALAAKALAESVTGQAADPLPVPLPSAWRIQPPQLLTFSFDDLPLMTFSVSTNGGATAPADATGPADNSAETVSDTGDTTDHAQPTPVANADDIPEGPALPPLFALVGTQLGTTLDTADDLINIPLSGDMAAMLGADTMRAADFFNFLILLSNPESLPEGTPSIPFDISGLIRLMSADAIGFIIEYDDTFLPNLDPQVYDLFSDDVLALPQIAPPLADTWDTLASQPQFVEMSLSTAADVIALGDGHAAEVLNTINADVPSQFAGYEVRLFDSLTPGVVRYFIVHESDFYSHLDTAVLEKLSPEVLALIPEDVLAERGDDVAARLTAIANGEQESAAQSLASLYTTNLPPADPDAPVLTALWGQVGGFMGIEMDSADDFFRFPAEFQYPDAATLMNSFFESAQGSAFAPQLFGDMSPEIVTYMMDRDPAVFDNLSSQALQLFPEESLALLPQALQDRAVVEGEPFTPTAAITRTNGNSSLLVTVYKSKEANTVEAFHTIDDLLQEIDASDDTISVAMVFEQSSFIEESISGVAREGGLGGIFAVVVILAFLSSGLWGRSPRRMAGIIMLVLFLALLGMFTLGQMGAANNDLGLAFQQVDVVVRVLLMIGALAGFVILLWPGNLPYPAWRSTLVVGVSIPLSLLMAFAIMRWIPPFMNGVLQPLAESSTLFQFIIRLFPESVTLNIMTLSGLTVAIGRVVDDSIVVLENIFREIQAGGSKQDAIIRGVRDVSVAIFAATLITAIVFLPLGMTGGIVSELFLPFGLAVTYSLLSSFLVAITVVPVLVFLFVSKQHLSEEEHESWLERLYLPILGWALANGRNKAIVFLVAVGSLVLSGLLFASRPFTFLPSFGEPQIGIEVSLPSGTKILETNALVEELETFIETTIPEDELSAIETQIGSGGQSLESFIGGDSVSENIASITIGVESNEQLDSWAQAIRTKAEEIFGVDNVVVSAASIAEQGFGGFALVLSGPQADLEKIDSLVVETLNNIDGVANAASNLQDMGASSDGPVTYIRIDRESALRYTAELETENTLGVTQQAVDAIKALPELPDSVKVSQGFESEIQTEGFKGMAVAMVFAIIIVIFILIAEFGSPVHWFDIILSIVVAPLGAAVALTLTDRSLGISAMIGLLMLIGIVVTNAVVLIDRVQANRRERHMNAHDALMEAGSRRLRPILMTALATIIALIPLAIGLSEGAIIASELGTVVIGGLFTSTLLTLILVPVSYSLLHPVHHRIMTLFSRNK